MSPSPKGSIRIPSETLNAFSKALFVAKGVSPEHAQTMANALTWADLRGVDTHGISRVPMYFRLLDSKEMNAAPNLHVIQETLALTVLEADRCAGPIAMQQASDIAMQKAKLTGIGLVMVRNTTHTASLGIYSEKVAKAGMACIALAASRPNMAYYGAKAAGVSTAPFSLAVPGPKGQAIILDMASGIVSLGKLAQLKAKNEELQTGWALDAQGQETIDPQKALTPLPLGGPKGSGLSLMFELMASLPVLNPLIGHFFSDKEDAQRHCQNAWIIAIDIAQVCSEASFHAEMDNTIKALKALPVDERVGTEILMPGERGYKERVSREKSGVPIPAKMQSTLHELALKYKVPSPF